MGSANWAPLKLDVGAAELMATPKIFMALCLPFPIYSHVQTVKGCSNILEIMTLFIYFCSPRKSCIGIQLIVIGKECLLQVKDYAQNEDMIKEGNCCIHEVIREQ